MTLVVLFLSSLFGIAGSLAAGHLVLRSLFRFRPLPWAVQDIFFAPSVIGLFALGPPMLFIGFVLFSMLFKNLAIDSVLLSDAHQHIFGVLIAIGCVLQLLLGQRLALASETSVALKQRLRVERMLFGAVHDLEKDAIATIELYRPILNARFRKIQIRLKNGGALRLVFGEEIHADLENWLNQG